MTYYSQINQCSEELNLPYKKLGTKYGNKGLQRQWSISQFQPQSKFSYLAELAFESLQRALLRVPQALKGAGKGHLGTACCNYNNPATYMNLTCAHSALCVWQKKNN